MDKERTFEEVLMELISLMDNPIASYVSKEEEKEIAQSLANISGLPDFLKQTMGADMRRYFSASPEEQKQIKGAFARTAYFLSLSIPKQNLDYTKNMVSGPRKKTNALHG